MTEEQKALLEMVAEELGGKLSYWICTSNNTEHKKIVIEYDFSRKG
jgi:16S rRNA C967 or C1407 C5-methylase (RsmB/RsmF family)